MSQSLTNNPLHNPFENRFNDPVTRRHDEMQADAYMMWLRERNQGCGQTEGATIVSDQTESNNDEATFASVLALFLVLVVSVAVLLKTI